MKCGVPHELPKELHIPIEGEKSTPKQKESGASEDVDELDPEPSEDLDESDPDEEDLGNRSIKSYGFGIAPNSSKMLVFDKLFVNTCNLNSYMDPSRPKAYMTEIFIFFTGFFVSINYC